MLKRLASTVLLGAIAMLFDHYGAHLTAIFLMCSAANAYWYDPPQANPEAK